MSSPNEYGGYIERGGGSSYAGLEALVSTVTASASKILDAQGSRANTCLVNLSTDTVIFVGNNASVSSTSGLAILPQTTLWLPYYGELHAIAPGGSASLSVGLLKT